MQPSQEENTAEKKWFIFGKWFITPLFAIGSGMITTVIASALPFIAALALPWLIPLLLAIFIAETAISAYLFKSSVPETLIAIFVKNIFQDLSPNKKILLGLGIFSALGGGLAIGALTYTSGMVAMGAIMGLCSIAFPPLGMAIAGILALTGFIAFSGLLIKWISAAIKNDAHKQISQFFINIWNRPESKSKTQHVLEGFFKLVFTASIITITIIGTIATLGTLQKGLTALFSLIPSANLLAAQIAAGVVSFVLLGIARLPWALQSVCSVFSALGELAGKNIYRMGAAIANTFGYNPTPVKEQLINDNNETVATTLVKTSAACIHAFSFGMLAESGGGKVINDLIIETKIAAPSRSTHNTADLISLSTGGIMALGIGAFSLFSSKTSKPSSSLDIKIETDTKASIVIHNKDSHGTQKSNDEKKETDQSQPSSTLTL